MLNNLAKNSGLKFRSASILILTLWVLAFLAIFGLYLNQGIRQKLSLVKNLSFRNNLYWIADAGIKKAIIELVKDETEFDTFSDSWSNNPSVFEGISVGLGKAVIYYEFSSCEGGKEERFGLLDEERKLNINTAGSLYIENLIEIVAKIDEIQAREIAASIVDWRDSDSVVSIPIGSAEDSYYDSLKEPYNCKDNAFEVLEEVLLVKGVDDCIFDKLKEFITIYGEGQININTTPLEILLAVGVNERVAEKLVEYRAGEDKVEGTSDDEFFQDTSSVVSKISGFTSLSETEIEGLEIIIAQELFTTGSMYFNVRARAEIGAMSREIVCVVSKKCEFVSWREP